jgi:thiamine biosynthesis lipoprotein
MKKIICFLLVFSTLLSFASCKTTTDGKESKTRSRTISSTHFNTASSIHTYADESDDNINSYASVADDLLFRYHKLFDIYYEYAGINNIKTINRNAGKSPVTVDKELIDFLEYCKELYAITRGKTNIMLGSVLSIWHDIREEADGNFGFIQESYLPTEEELNEAAKHTSIDLLVIDREASTVYISDPEASIDVGAVAKGYAVDILHKRLVEMGADSVVLNIGGNVRTIGLKPSGEEWVTGITNPDKTSDDSLICKIKIGDTSIVTSGDYERFFYAGDKKYHHIIDPVTLYPADYFSSVSIITENSALADALSTALFCMSYEEGKALIESLDVEVDVIWIDLDYNLTATDGIELVADK